MIKNQLSAIPKDFNSVKLKLASPEKILEWSNGEVTRAETINYRTQKPERDGLFCEKIFGPVKDYECHCGKYRRIRYKGIICDRCGVEVTRSIVRRSRMGHIKLVAPVSHIWYLKGSGSSKVALVLGLTMSQIEKVVYFASYIITNVSEDARKQSAKDMESEYKMKLKKLAKVKGDPDYESKLKKLENAYDIAKAELEGLTRLRVISEEEYRNLSIKYGQVFEAAMGAGAIRDLLNQIDLRKLKLKLSKDLKETKTEAPKKKIRKRLMLVDSLLKSNTRPEWMIMTAIPVIPPDLRPMVPLDGGRYATSDLNDLYRRVINRNNRLKKLLELGAPEVITRNEKRMLQESVDSLFDNQARKGQSVQASTGQLRLLKSLTDNLKGKNGRFRQNLLGKRVDYSGRSVIVVGPELKLGECGLPKIMALEMFKPFVINKLIESGKAHNVRSASRFIDSGADEIWQVLENVISDKVVLLNRAPTLHRLGIQAFKPVLVEDKAIHLHPLVCSAFNADFDGDQMAVHLPLTKAAEEEAKTLMLSTKNLLKPASGEPIVGPAKEMILGCYYLTKIKKGDKKSQKMFSNIEQTKYAYDLDKIGLQELIKVRVKGNVEETTVGRIIFNDVFPEDYPFINETISKKTVEKEIKKVLEKYGQEAVVRMVDKVKELGFKYATRSGNSLAITDLIVPKKRDNILNEAESQVLEVNNLYEQGLITKAERYTKLIEIWTETKNNMDEEIKKVYPKNNPLYDQLDSQTQGWPIMSMLVGMKGLVADPSGRLIETPIKDNFKHGYDILEFFTSTHGTRKGLADTALKTSSSGYLTRRMVDVAQELVITEKDCGDTKGFIVKKDLAEDADERFKSNIEGRYIIDDIRKNGKVIVKKDSLITLDLADKIIKLGIKEVKIRSVLSCKTRHGICQKCYGTDLGLTGLVKMGTSIGVVAAQAMGEPGTQLTMRTKNVGTGKQSAGKDIVTGLPRVEELLEARNPKDPSLIAEITGSVKILKDPKNKDSKIVQISGKEGGKKVVKKYEVNEEDFLLVEDGDLVYKGTQITEGSVNVKELYKKAGFEETCRYIINEIQKIYASQGEIVSGKHVETIIHQMFARYKIVDAGDTELVDGNIVTKEKFEEANDLANTLRKKKAKGERQILGISKASLSTDSFLSAASFKETARVLIDAAITGKEDKLNGLKENVIIGKLIPAGTGFKPNSI